MLSHSCARSSGDCVDAGRRQRARGQDAAGLPGGTRRGGAGLRTPHGGPARFPRPRAPPPTTLRPAPRSRPSRRPAFGWSRQAGSCRLVTTPIPASLSKGGMWPAVESLLQESGASLSTCWCIAFAAKLTRAPLAYQNARETGRLKTDPELLCAKSYKILEKLLSTNTPLPQVAYNLGDFLFAHEISNHGLNKKLYIP